MHEVMVAEEEDAWQKSYPLRQVTLTMKPGLGKDPNVYYLPTGENEVAAIFVGDVPPMRNDISIYPKNRPLQFISPLNVLADLMTVRMLVILPLPFYGSERHMYQCYQDSIAIMHHFVRPDLFITFTCTPKWLEIVISVEGRQQVCDRPDLECRVFKVKLDSLIEDIHKKQIFGKVLAYIYAIESQKWGLPHAHILIILDKGDKIAISTKVYDNKHAVPYNPYLLQKYMCHTNMEICSSLQVSRYLDKYIHEGHDSEVLQVGDIVRDEITSYFDSRYVTSPEACWMLLSFKMANENIIVVWLALHLENEQSVFIQDNDVASTLERAHDNHMEKGDFNTISQIHNVSPQTNEELLFLQLLLHVRSPISFEDLHTACHTVHPTYKLACMDLLLLDRDDIYQVTMYEAERWSVPGCLKVIFSHLLFHCNIADPQAMYNNLKPYLLDDTGAYLETSENRVLMDIQFHMGVFSKFLADYGLNAQKVVVSTISSSPNDIGWALMAPKEVLHCVDRLLWDVTKNDSTKFGDKVLLLGGDFKQVLPVVSHRGRIDQRQEEFQQFLLHTGEGTCPNIPGLPEGYVKITDYLVLLENADICSHIFGHGVLTEEVISTWTILCLRNKDVYYINAIMVVRFSGDCRRFLNHCQLEDSNKDNMSLLSSLIHLLCLHCHHIP
ncbi:hypothetical protein PR048_010329 [Dryococelus australis]|uniref:ATP-dependent DNA helicase n=1 Tax=Dryococelus australis TaxID=614101 RepID=A0ABQ9I2D2_9NEOP|nr:hypothetical protein PR048_010329 [Dryococelus australis]